MNNAPRHGWLLAAGIFVSGFASLGYQIVWSKRLAVEFGLESIAILAVLTAFMGGYAIGAFLLERPLRQSRHARSWLVLIEGLIAVWGLGSIFLLQWIPKLSVFTSFLNEGGLVAFITTLLISLCSFIPATVAMGCTLPAMERVWRDQQGMTRCVGRVYGINTAGAAIGISLVSYWGIRLLGLNQTVIALASLNTLAALLFWRLPATGNSKVALEPSKSWSSPPIVGFLKLFSIGFLGMCLQFIVLRLLSQTLANTTYTYAVIVTAYLVGTSGGALLFQRDCNHPRRTPGLQKGALVTGFAVIGSLFLISVFHQIYPSWVQSIQADPSLLILTELCAALVVLLLPTLGSGYLFAFFLQHVGSARGAFGCPLGFNLIGSMVAPLFLYLCLPLLGSHAIMLAIAAGYCCMAGLEFWRRRWKLGFAFVLLLLMAPDSRKILGVYVRPPEKITISEGPFGVVSVFEEADQNKRLDLNNRFLMGGSRAARAEQRQAHIPLLLHPQPTRALFLGVGTGITLGATLDHPNLSIDAVELVPEIVGALPEFKKWNRHPYSSERVIVHTMDARRFVRQSTTDYDVIVGDVFHPTRDGAGLLYTREHFRALRGRLAKGGVFCQWLPLHQLSEQAFRTICGTLQSEFPYVGLWLLDANIELPVVGLIATTSPLIWSRDRYQNLGSTPSLNDALKFGRLHSPIRLISNLLVPDLTVIPPLESARLNTDNHQIIGYQSPLEQLPDKPFLLLQPYLDHFVQNIATAEDSNTAAQWIQSWESELASRDQYLRGQLAASAGRHDEAIQEFLSGVSLGREFTLNYSQIVSIATEASSNDPRRAATLLTELINRRPEVKLAQRLLDRLTLNSPNKE